MRALVVEDGIVTNAIIVDSLDFQPGLIDGEAGGEIGDRYENGQFFSPLVDIEKLASTARVSRNALLLESDWTQLSDSPVDKAIWSTYRQALRDIPQQDGFPENIVWPDKPM